MSTQDQEAQMYRQLTEHAVAVHGSSDPDVIAAIRWESFESEAVRWVAGVVADGIVYDLCDEQGVVAVGPVGFVRDLVAAAEPLSLEGSLHEHGYSDVVPATVQDLLLSYCGEGTRTYFDALCEEVAEPAAVVLAEAAANLPQPLRTAVARQGLGAAEALLWTAPLDSVAFSLAYRFMTGRADEPLRVDELAVRRSARGR